MSKTSTVYILVILLFPVFSFAQFAKYSNDFLNIGTDARAMAMANTQVAIVNDGTAGYWNPAGLAAVKDLPNINLMHAEYFSGIGQYDYGSIAIPIQNNKRTFGISFLRFGVDDIPNTLNLVDPSGAVNYNNITSFSVADYAVLLSYGQYIMQTKAKTISFGFNAKIIHQTAGSFANSWGFGFDGGVQMQKGKWQLGIMAKDVTTTFNAWSFSFTDQEKQELLNTNNAIPTQSTELTAPSLIVGNAYNFKISRLIGLLAEADLDITFDGKRNTIISSNPVSIAPSIGLEASLNKVFFVRAGITNFQQAFADGDTLNQKKTWTYQPTVGAGIKIKNVIIDYAFSDLANQSSPLYTNVFSIKFNLVKKKENH
jgi:hypothetical protein